MAGVSQSGIPFVSRKDYRAKRRIHLLPPRLPPSRRNGRNGAAGSACGLATRDRQIREAERKREPLRVLRQPGSAPSRGEVPFHLQERMLDLVRADAFRLSAASADADLSNCRRMFRDSHEENGFNALFSNAPCCGSPVAETSDSRIKGCQMSQVRTRWPLSPRVGASPR